MQRLVGLDAVKLFLLVLGIVTHAVAMIGGDHWTQWLTVASNAFRMEAFFLIAGLLAAHSLSKKDAELWWARRRLALGMPFLSTYLLVLIPAAILVSSKYSLHSFDARQVPLSSLHLWFLIVLFSCSWLNYNFERSRRTRVEADILFRRLVAGLKPWQGSILFVVLTSTWLMMTSFMTLSVQKRIETWSFVQESETIKSLILEATTLLSVVHYLPFYGLGYMIMRHRGRGLRVIYHPLLYSLILVVTIGALHNLHGLGVDTFPYNFIEPSDDHAITLIVIRSLIAPVCSVFCLIVALCIRHASETVSLLSRSAYTSYLLHFPLLSHVLVPQFRPYLDVSVLTLVTTLAALGFGYLAHMLVSRSDILMFLFSGRISKQMSSKARTVLVITRIWQGRVAR